MTTRDIGFAVIGCGLMGARHVEILHATPGARVVCVVDTDLDTATRTAALCPDSAVVASSYEAALARSDIDAVVICLPSGQHAAAGMLAARAGKHVIMEKPIAVKTGDGQRLVDECERAGVLCAVICQNRFSDAMQAVKAAFDRGDMGAPLLGRASVKWYRHDPYYAQSNWRGRVDGEGGGVLMNQAVHSLDQLIWFFGEPTEVKGMTHHSRAVLETEDVGLALLRFPGGAIATLEASTSTFPGFEERIEIHTSLATAIIERGNLIFWSHQNDLPTPEPPVFPPATPGLSPKYALFQRQYFNILDAIHGRAPLVVTPQQAVSVVENTLAIYAEEKAQQNGV
ncbi:hypothetical protein CVU37_00505 [candidate division BRC1 bacterium HGW-BRC1-1]|jgi:predicted dehydrogenase|nr:MAG: hypothetical protein CVU37_00505 [candidate division BRC1 bacterium HGW-BRC1-1]